MAQSGNSGSLRGLGKHGWAHRGFPDTTVSQIRKTLLSQMQRTEKTERNGLGDWATKPDWWRGEIPGRERSIPPRESRRALRR